MKTQITPAAFNAWADRVGLAGASREAIRLITLEGASINSAARALSLAPSTVSRANAKYRYSYCPCCGQKIEAGTP